MVTKDQALAFIEALTGHEDIANNGEDDSGRPKSPHAMTFLEAHLGSQQVVTRYRAWTAIQGNKFAAPKNAQRKELVEFLRLLSGVVMALEEALDAAVAIETEPQRPAEAAAQARDGGA